MEASKIAAALVKAQKGFAPALKSSTNPHFRSKYAALDACVEAVIDSLNANGIFLSQHLTECADGVIVETVFLHESGEGLSCGKLHVPAPKNDPQGYGSALTYARRYSLMAACGIAPEDDDGNAASKRPEQKPVQNAPEQPTQASVNAVIDHLNDAAKNGNKELKVALSKISEEVKAAIPPKIKKDIKMVADFADEAAMAGQP